MSSVNNPMQEVQQMAQAPINKEAPPTQNTQPAWTQPGPQNSPTKEQQQAPAWTQQPAQAQQQPPAQQQPAWQQQPAQQQPAWQQNTQPPAQQPAAPAQQNTQAPAWQQPPAQTQQQPAWQQQPPAQQQPAWQQNTQAPAWQQQQAPAWQQQSYSQWPGAQQQAPAPKPAYTQTLAINMVKYNKTSKQIQIMKSGEFIDNSDIVESMEKQDELYAYIPQYLATDFQEKANQGQWVFNTTAELTQAIKGYIKSVSKDKMQNLLETEYQRTQINLQQSVPSALKSSASKSNITLEQAFAQTRDQLSKLKGFTKEAALDLIDQASRQLGIQYDTKNMTKPELIDLLLTDIKVGQQQTVKHVNKPKAATKQTAQYQPYSGWQGPQQQPQWGGYQQPPQQQWGGYNPQQQWQH